MATSVSATAHMASPHPDQTGTPEMTTDTTPFTQPSEAFALTPRQDHDEDIEHDWQNPLSASQRDVERLLNLGAGVEAEQNYSVHPPPDKQIQLTAREVQADPILSSLAKKQIAPSTPTTTGGGFKARPAPTSTRAQGLGPRMTKAAALRAGLKWEESPRPRDRGREGKEGKSGQEARDEVGTPGYKRVGLGINIPSLAAPSIAPRQTKASQLRQAGGTDPTATATATIATTAGARRDPEVVAAENRARAAEEKERRRKSIVLPASLSAPSIAPRQNKSSLLRTNSSTNQPTPKSFKSLNPKTSTHNILPQTPSTPTSAESKTFALSRATSALKLTLADNRRDPPASASASVAHGQTEKSEGVKRRASVVGVVRSLGTPSITPRLNRAAMLRAPPPPAAASGGTSSPFPAPSNPVAQRPKPKSRPQSQIITSTTSIKSIPFISTTRTAPSPGPKPTKASLLRANMGKGKVAS